MKKLIKYWPEKVGSALAACNSRLVSRRFWLWVLRWPVAIILLWAITYNTFEKYPGRAYFRIDRKEAVAYPMSDAAGDFMKALAILEHDGWINWGGHAVWTTYKPGWGAFLAFIAWTCDRDTAKMQSFLTILFAFIGPAFYFVVCAMYTDLRVHAFAFLLTTLFVVQIPGWWYANTMMTEAPAMLLSMIVCGIGVYACNRDQWRNRDGFIFGLFAAVLCLLRSQVQYAVAAIIILILLGSLRKLRARFMFLIFFLCGFLWVSGPFYLKTSYHIKAPYTGTSYTALLTAVWISKKDCILKPEDLVTEKRAMQVMSERAKEAVLSNWKSKTLKSALVEIAEHFRIAFFGLTGHIFGKPNTNQYLALIYSIIAVGLLLALFLCGVNTWIPFAFFMGYSVPFFACSVYMGRYVVPIYWVGLCYTCSFILVLKKSSLENICSRLKVFRSFWSGKNRGNLPKTAPPGKSWRENRLFFLITFIWIAAWTLALIKFDLSPPPEIVKSALLADQRTQRVLATAGIQVDSVLEWEIESAFRQGGKCGRVRILNVFLPITIEPKDAAFKYPWNQQQGLVPHQETYTHYHAVTPLKISKKYHVVQNWNWNQGYPPESFSARGKPYENFRHGDRVIVVQSNPKSFYADAIFPTKWANGKAENGF